MTRAEAVAAQLANRIWTGELLPGQRLPPERLLAAEMGVSRPTLRAAIRALGARDLVEVSHGRSGGATVRCAPVPPDLVPGAEPVVPAEIAGLLKVRRALELRVVLLAAARATPDDLAALRDLVDRQRAAPSSWDLHQQFDTWFHMGLARATHNATVYELMRTLQARLARARQSSLRTPQDPQLLAAVHERTLRAVIVGDAQEIERDMDEHLGWLEKAWTRETARASRVSRRQAAM